MEKNKYFIVAACLAFTFSFASCVDDSQDCTLFSESDYMMMKYSVASCLRTVVDSSDAKFACIILSDVKTGELLARADYHDEEFNCLLWHNDVAGTVAFYPGFAFSFPMLAAIDSYSPIDTSATVSLGNCSIGDRYLCDNVSHAIDVPFNKAISSHARTPLLRLFQERFDTTNRNDFFAVLDMVFPPQSLDNAANDFFSCQQLDVDSVCVRLLTGYGLKVTPYQLAVFYNAIANKGLAYAPDGRISRRFDASTADKLLDVMKICGEEWDSVVMRQRPLDYYHYYLPYLTGGKYWPKAAIISASAKAYANTDSTLFNNIVVLSFPAEAPRYSCLLFMGSTHDHANAYIKSIRLLINGLSEFCLL